MLIIKMQKKVGAKGLTDYRITIEFLHNFFKEPAVIFSSHAMLINASTKDFTPIHLVTFSI